MKRFIGQRIIKTSLGATLAIFIAELIGLSQIYSAGIIVILSMQSTKRDSIDIAIKRAKSVLLALILSSVIFILLAKNIFTFGLFLLIFIPLCVKLKISDGIVVSAVLVTHLLPTDITLNLLLNEIGLFAIGASVALLLNLYMPSIEPKLKEEIRYIEELMRDIILEISNILYGNHNLDNLKTKINFIETRVTIGHRGAYKLYNNSLLINLSYYMDYLKMRELQINTIKGMLYNLERIYNVVHQSIILANYTKKVSLQFSEKNDCEELLSELYSIRQSFKDMELPKTREEFENRAILFRYLGDMEHFIKLKRDFALLNNTGE